MVDPVTGALASAISKGAVDTIRERIQESENPKEQWRASVRQCVIDAQDTFDTYAEDPDVPNYDRLAPKLENIAKSARGLANEGEREGYDEELTGLVDAFATACTDYASAPTFNDWEPEEEFNQQLDEVGGEILEKTDE